MSKAFTKDDGPDAAPVPRRRAPLPPGTPNYVTERGLRALRDELERLAHAPHAPGGDAHAQATAQWRAELEERVATAVVVSPPQDRGEARFGATVTLRDAEGGARVVRIVGVDEADAGRGLVAFTAPLARALLGRRAGDLVAVRAPGGEDEIEIVGITWDD